ncbi:tripartite tricarboxylate transporter substrate-binding protein [Pseudonocardia sp. ICBG601]|uniref:tripartite tricarboxylate transporter substrate-binding protein n=1 Tax=Pseudonocardia sp. ICBG601 TaxID=2846759 RepID=UPI001CF64769|nr:tripartite tricarboxylate transporter substrate-binding protein [Pseudonocardia sp. ICBG601]
MLVLALAAVVVPIVLTGGPRPLSDLRILVPNPPGGGYDVTARSAAKVLSDNGITGPVEVFNLSGAGGIAGLGRIEGEAGNGRLLMSMGLGVVGATASRDTPLSLADTTPIARLTEESEIVVVPADSPYRDVRALLDAWHAAPGGLTVGGGSTVGGPDHLATMLLAEGAGIAPARSTTRPTRAAVRCSRRCCAARWPSRCPGWASSPTRSGPVTCGCSR